MNFEQVGDDGAPVLFGGVSVGDLGGSILRKTFGSHCAFLDKLLRLLFCQVSKSMPSILDDMSTGEKFVLVSLSSAEDVDAMGPSSLPLLKIFTVGPVVTLLSAGCCSVGF